MPLVVDLSVAAVWALCDEEEPAALAVLERLEHDIAVVPVLFWFEIRNVLAISERRRRLRPDEGDAFILLLAGLDFVFDDNRSDDVLRLARRHHLTVYDAAYLELARRRGLPLATLDRHLAAAARAEGIDLLSP